MRKSPAIPPIAARKGAAGETTSRVSCIASGLRRRAGAEVVGGELLVGRVRVDGHELGRLRLDRAVAQTAVAGIFAHPREVAVDHLQARLPKVEAHAHLALHPPAAAAVGAPAAP